MSSGETVIDSMNIQLHCPVKGHDRQIISHIYPIASFERQLLCTNCLALDFPDIAKKCVTINEYLIDKYDAHAAIQKEM